MKIIRVIAERFFRNRILRRKILVAGEWISLFVSPDSQLKYLKIGSGVFDQDLINIAEKFLRENSNVWDVGANVGVFSFASSVVANKGAIVSIEPDIWLAGILRKTSKLKEYSDKKIKVVPVAVSSENGVASFMIAKRGRACNALESFDGRSQMGGVREFQYVPTLTLDTLLQSFPAPDFVKIDIEGAELSAIEGGEELIRKIRPIFYIEVGNKVSSQIFNIFKLSDYIALNPQGEVLIDTCAQNTFFAPSEKLSEITLIFQKTK